MLKHKTKLVQVAESGKPTRKERKKKGGKKDR